MRQKRRGLLAGLVIAVAASGLQAHIAASQTQATSVEVTGLDPGAALDLALNGGKIGDATAGSDGRAVMTASIGGDRARVNVWVDRCQDGKIVKVHFVVEGHAEPPKDEDCDRKLAGWFWSNARRVAINVRTGTVQTPGRLTPRTIGLIGAGVAGGGILIASSGGDGIQNNNVSGNTPGNQTPGGQTPFNPAGNYQITTARKTDPGEHFFVIQLMTTGVLTAGMSNVTMTIAGPPGSNWVTVTGTYDSSTNRFVLTGTGTVAGRPNVGVRFEGTITTSGALSGDYTMGTGGELPGGQAIVYSVTGQRQ